MGKLTWGVVRRSAIATSALLLGACGLRGVAPAQAQGGEPLESPVVAYRIDDHRYFEITPKANGLCTGRTLYFVDTAKNIHSQVVGWDNVMTRGKLIIDAANDDYLIGPVTRGGNTNCSSGGG
ncbi:T6SS immunity protein Tli3 family protein, partial [Pseudacidovorax intermedius]|uniref:T6SS immunity protein Tli3 family protein n=1 Tax=Pseudacidovorax intermedius TaxID=433924 RepID=UPI0018CBBBDA